MPPADIDWTKDPRDPRSFLQAWCGAVTDALQAQLPGGGRFLTHVERSVREDFARAAEPEAPAGPAPTLQAPARFTDRFGVSVLDAADAGRVAACVLFVTPDNKSDSDAALALAVRAAGLVSAGAGVVIVDALPGPPSWATHLHSLVGVYPIARRPRGGEAPVLVVRPEVRDGGERFAVWHHGVAAGFPLPTVPVPVRGAAPLTLDLEATYLYAYERSRPV